MRRSLPSCVPCLRAQLARRRSTVSSRAQSTVVSPARERVDPSTIPLLRDLHLGTKQGRARKSLEGVGNPNNDIDYLEFEKVEDLELSGASSSARNDVGLQGEIELGDSERREERRSPAAAFGSKRIGSVILPEIMIDSIQNQIDLSNPKDLRQSYLSLLPSLLPARSKSSRPLPTAHLPPASPSEKAIPKSRQSAVTPLLGLAMAAGWLPGEYAAVRNVLRELKGRLGTDFAGSDGEVVVWDGGLGSAVWAMMDLDGSLPPTPTSDSDDTPQLESLTGRSMIQIQSSLHLLNLSTTLLSSLPHPPTLARHFYRQPSSRTPALALSTFHLSKLPTRAIRLARLKDIWDSGADTIVLIDRGDKKGFEVISEARSYLLALGRDTPVASPEDSATVSQQVAMNNKERKAIRKEERRRKREEKMRSRIDFGDEDEPDGMIKIGAEIYYEDGAETKPKQAEPREEVEMVGSHVVAPCPHDGPCPLLATADICHFSQRYQSPPFLRKTKHSLRGEEDVKYTYVVVRRGARPAAEGNVGRLGAVGKEERQKAQEKLAGKRGVLVPVGEGGHFSVMETYEVQREEPLEVEELEEKGLSNEETESSLRSEAYSWPRLVYPPLKRQGHVILDTCHPSGSIVRLTIPRSQSKQIYHDARKIYWGDLFPHQSKLKGVVRTRGVKRLLDFVDEPQEPMNEELSADGNPRSGRPECEGMGGMDLWPVAELEKVGNGSADIEDELGLNIDWEKAETDATISEKEQDVIVRTFGE